MFSCLFALIILYSLCNVGTREDDGEERRREWVVYRFKRRKTVDLYTKEREEKLFANC